MTASLFDLTGKVVLITGANSGLGLGFANAIARAGGDVVIWGRRADKNEEAARALRAYGGRVLAQAVDVSDEALVASSLREAVAELGRIDSVIANAGFNERLPSFHEMSSDSYHRLLAVNLHGAVYTLREGVAHMVERAEAGDPGGSLIVCGSLTVLRGVARIEHYAAAKGALAAVMRGIAVEYGPRGIRANMIAPGYFASDIGGRDPEVVERMSQTVAKIPIPRPGHPDDLAGIVVYLVSDASAYHTGDVIVVDGGMSVSL